MSDDEDDKDVRVFTDPHEAMEHLRRITEAKENPGVKAVDEHPISDDRQFRILTKFWEEWKRYYPRKLKRDIHGPFRPGEFVTPRNNFFGTSPMHGIRFLVLDMLDESGMSGRNGPFDIHLAAVDEDGDVKMAWSEAIRLILMTEYTGPKAQGKASVAPEIH